MPVPPQKYREIVFQMLYSHNTGLASDENMLELLSKELAVTKNVVKDAQERVHQICTHQKEIDSKIAATSHSYAFERIQSVECNILRLGVFELLYDKTVPFKVVMAEASRLARKFATKEAASFINAILDAIYKSSLGEAIDTKQLQQAVNELTLIEKVSHEASQTVKTTPKQDATHS